MTYSESELTFEQIQSHINRNELHALLRSKSEQERYIVSLTETRKRWATISDFILHDKFHLDYEVDRDGKFFVPRHVFEGQKSTCVRNDFPYNFEKRVQHMVYWKLGGDVTVDELHRAAQELREKIQFDGYAVFVNPPSLKSIKDVSHGHIILKLKPRYLPYLIMAKSGKIMVIGISVFGTMFFGKMFLTALSWRQVLVDAKALVNRFSLEKVLLFYCNYFAPFPIGSIMKYIYRSYKV